MTPQIALTRFIDFLEDNDELLVDMSAESSSPPGAVGYLFEEHSRKLIAIPANIWKTRVFTPKTAKAAAAALEGQSVLLRKITVAEQDGWVGAKEIGVVVQLGPYVLRAENEEDPQVKDWEARGGRVFSEFRASRDARYVTRGERYPASTLQHRRSFLGNRGWYYVVDAGRLMFLKDLGRNIER